MNADTPARREAAFWSRVARGSDSECWPWTGSFSSNGYPKHGRFWAHRYSYELLVGLIPAGLVIDHLCRTPACVNPAHLEPVTYRENVVRGLANTGRPHFQETCFRGHRYSAMRGTWRRCEECRRVRRRAAREAARGELVAPRA